MGCEATSGDPIVTRPAEPADAEELEALFEELGHPATTAQLATRLTRVQSDPTYQAWIALSAEHVPVGFAAGHLVHPIEDDRPAAQLIALVSSTQARGTGVGTALCRTFEDWALTHGAQRAVVNSGNLRQSAHEFYQRDGWTHTGIRLAKPLP